MNYNFKNLVFEGGGVKGIAYGGALERLEEMGILDSIERVAGTSAGAITAALLAVGYSPKEISKIISDTDFKKFEDNTFLYIRDIIRLIRDFGWNRGDVFEKWLGELIKAKTGNENFTFIDLYKGVTKKVDFRDLYVICSNITNQQAEVLSYETAPLMSIKRAVRMSMSIPIYFAATKNSKGDIIVDGGVTLNYPVNIFDNLKYMATTPPDTSNLFDTYSFNYQTLGFRVDSIKSVNYLQPNWEIAPEPVKNLKSYVGALINFMMEIANKQHLNNDDWNRTVFIDSMDVKTTQFKLSREQIDNLIKNGRSGVDHYFNWRDSDEKWSKMPK